MPLGYFTDSTPLTPLRDPFNVLVDGINANEVALSGATGVRQIQTFRWANSAARTAQTGMQAGDIGYQIDTGVQYLYSGSAWISEDPPAPQVVSSNSTNIITSTSFADLPTTVTTSLVLPAAAWVDIEARAWMTASANDVRMSFAVSGATTVAEATPAHGAYAIQSQNTSVTGVARRTLQLNAGTNTITIRALRTTSGTQTVNYPVLTVIPLRWA